jgi:hypothetical protein
LVLVELLLFCVFLTVHQAFLWRTQTSLGLLILVCFMLQPPYSYSPSRRQAAVQQLQWVEASLCRGAAMARLRALLLQQGRLNHWEQAAAAAAAAAAEAESDGSSSSSALLDTGGRLITPEQMYHEAWKIQRQQQQQQQRQQEPSDPWGAAAAADGSRTVFQPPYQTVTSLGGRVLWASFHTRVSGSSSGSSMLRATSGVAAAVSAAAGSGGVSEGAAGAEVFELCHVLQQLTTTIRSLKDGLSGSTSGALGVLPEVQR